MYGGQRLRVLKRIAWENVNVSLTLPASLPFNREFAPRSATQIVEKSDRVTPPLAVLKDGHPHIGLRFGLAHEVVGPVVGHEVEALLVVTRGLHLAGQERHGNVVVCWCCCGGCRALCLRLHTCASATLF